MDLVLVEWNIIKLDENKISEFKRKNKIRLKQHKLGKIRLNLNKLNNLK